MEVSGLRRRHCNTLQQSSPSGNASWLTSPSDSDECWGDPEEAPSEEAPLTPLAVQLQRARHRVAQLGIVLERRSSAERDERIGLYRIVLERRSSAGLVQDGAESEDEFWSNSETECFDEEEGEAAAAEEAAAVAAKQGVAEVAEDEEKALAADEAATALAHQHRKFARYRAMLAADKEKGAAAKDAAAIAELTQPEGFYELTTPRSLGQTKELWQFLDPMDTGQVTVGALEYASQGILGDLSGLGNVPLTKESFYTFLKELKAQGTAKHFKDLIRRVVENVQNDQLEELFSMWDFDGSGFIEAGELNRVIELHKNADDTAFLSEDEQMALADCMTLSESLTCDKLGEPSKQLDLQKFSAFIKGEVKALGNSASSFNDVVWIFRDLVVATKAVDTDDDEFDPTDSPNVLCNQLVMSRSLTDDLTAQLDELDRLDALESLKIL